MTTKIYGASDDLIEFEGDVRGEVSCYGTDEDESLGVIVAFDDGTLLLVKYCGDPHRPGVWQITPVVKGTLFDRLERCDQEDGDDYSDCVYLRDGAMKAWWGSNAQVVS